VVFFAPPIPTTSAGIWKIPSISDPRFAVRQPTWLAPEDTERLREAMATITRAGLIVSRQSSKFDQPAFAFSVASLAHQSAS
jgi:hypothetical protein